MQLILSGCSGGSVSGPEEPPQVDTPDIAASFISGNTSFIPGEFQFIQVSGINLTETKYPGLVSGDIEVTLIRDIEATTEQRILFIVPEATPGNASLRFVLDGEDLLLDFNVEEYESIPDAAAYLDDFFMALTSQKDYLLTLAGSTQGTEYINNVFIDLEESLQSLNTLGEDEKALLARIFKTNFADDLLAGKNLFGLKNDAVLTCETAQSHLVNVTAVTVATISSIAIGSLIKGSVVLTPLGILITGGSSAYFAASLMPLINSIGTYIDVCYTNEFTTLSMGGSSKVLTVSNDNTTFEFDHDKSISFEILSLKVLDGQFISLANELLLVLEPIRNLLPSSWLQALTIQQEPEIIPEDPSLAQITSVSDEDILFETQAAGQLIDITFYFDETTSPSVPVDFSFTLTDNSTYETAISARLNPPLPEVFNMLFEVTKGSSVQDTLKANFANNFTITGWPENGNLNLIDQQEGIFIYQPNELFQGEDTFSFRASNSVGESETADIELLVVSEICPESYTDPRDGREYGIVELNNRCYFTENLNFATVNSRCSEDNPANCGIYGRLYNWDEAVGVCPAGTYLPQLSEWLSLFNFLGGEEIAGGRLKSEEYWSAPNPGTYDSGFNALPGGSIDHQDTMYGPGGSASFWTSTYNDEVEWDSKAFSLGLNHTRERAYWGDFFTSAFFSVRCGVDL